MADEKSFLGKGWAFPPVFHKESKKVEMVSQLEDIEQSIQIILRTIPGERVMLPEFGCGINRFVYQSMDVTQTTMLRDTIYDALLYFEPRIKLSTKDITIDTHDILDGKLLINISYTVIITNSRSNMVFPYYLSEGTNI